MTNAIGLISYSACILLLGVIILALIGLVSIAATVATASAHWRELTGPIKSLLIISAMLAGLVLYRLITPQ